MFDVGFSELVLMAIVALVVLGPEKLPHAARVAGAWVGRIRRTVSNMQAEIEREVSAQELRERLQKEIDAVQAASEEAEKPFQAVVSGVQELQSGVNSILPPATTTGISVSAVTLPEPMVLPPVVMPPEVLQPELLEPAVSALSGNTGTEPATALSAPDGEAAYREWLASQKNSNLRPGETAPPPAKDDAAS